MNKEITIKKVDALIRVASEGKYKSYAETQSLNQMEQTSLLQNIEKKLVVMNFVDTFENSLLEKFKITCFEQQIPIGAFAQMISIGLGEGRQDVITKPTDFLPPQQALYNMWYINYAKTFMINFTMKYTILINQDLFRLFFTSISGVGSYLNIYNNLGVKTYLWEIYNTALYLMLLQVRNIRDLGTFNYKNDAEKASQLRLIFDTMSEVLNEDLPSSIALNIGLAVGEKSYPKGTDNNKGLDFANIPPKRNTIMTVKNERNIRSFPEFNLIMTPNLSVQFTRKVLADIYNSDFASFENMFGSVIDAQKSVFNVNLPKVNDKYPSLDFYVDNSTDGTKDDETFTFLVMEQDSFMLGTNININGSNVWAEGEGGPLLHRVLHVWSTLGVIPFKNGVKFTFRLTKKTS